MATTTLPVDRRTFLVASTAGVAGLGFGQPMLAAAQRGRSSAPQGKAKSTILFFLCGGASHLDTWDTKPDAPAEYRGPFKTVGTAASGVNLCEHLPMLGKQAKHLAVVKSVAGTVNTNDHHAGYYHNLTGHVPDQSFKTLGNNRTPFPDDWPYMGSVVAMKRSQHPYLPNAITLPHKPSRAPYTRPGQFAARIGVEHDPLYINGNVKKPLEFTAPSITLNSKVSKERLAERYRLMREIDNERRALDHFSKIASWDKQQERAISLLASAKTAHSFDVASEPKNLRERYGENVNGMSLLMARRLVEAGVPFITVFWREHEMLNKKCKSAGGWDTHGNNFNCLKDDLLPMFDRGFSALIEDLSDRDLLDDTLLVVNSEMGRKPKIGDPRSGGAKGAGRDHWTHCLSVLLAGGGIQGGQTYGESDRFGGYPEDQVVKPAHIAKTVYHAMGIDDLTAYDNLGRPYDLLADGEPIYDLF